MKKKGFTLIELLVVISIIAMLLAVLIPSVNKVRIYTKNMSQSYQFRNIDIGLQSFSAENESEYPNSGEDFANGIFGGQRLCEALVGRDLFGHDKNGKSIGLYSTSFDDRSNYIDTEKYTFVNPVQLYGTAMTTIAGDDSTQQIADFNPVICDLFGQKKITVQSYNKDSQNWTDKEILAGTPILYFRANKTNLFMNNDFMGSTGGAAPIYANCSQWTYDWTDNEEFFNLPTMKSFGTANLEYHNYYSSGADTGKQAFYENLINLKITTHIAPVNKDSYILISSGFDGIYGTRDDITNFDNKR